MKIKFIPASIFLLITTFFSAYADVKIKQKITAESQAMEQTRMIKGARERRETKIAAAGEDENALMSAMPNIATITQCDLRRTLQVNDKKKLYTVEPFADSADSAPPAPAVSVKTKKGGLVTITYTVTDTGERKTMFGLQARHLKILQMTESSADSCGGAGKSKIEFDGWYADFSADFNCPIDVPDMPPQTKPDCRDRVVYKRSGTVNPGFLIDGTMRSFGADGKVQSTIRTETLEISRSPLDSSFFDVGADYKLAGNAADLYAMPSMSEMMAMADGKNETVSVPQSVGKKSVGLDFFKGDYSKIDQDSQRQTMMENLNSEGFAASFVTSPNEISNGRFDYVIGVEIISVKQSKAAKIGGLFGKVTGSADASKVGDSEAEVVVTVYKKDGKTITAQQKSKQKIAGSPDEATRSAIESALNQLYGKMN